MPKYLGSANKRTRHGQSTVAVHHKDGTFVWYINQDGVERSHTGDERELADALQAWQADLDESTDEATKARVAELLAYAAA